MKRLTEELLQEEKSLNRFITAITKSLKDAPEGRLRISHKKKSVQYYYRHNKTNSKKYFEGKINETEFPYLKSVTDNVESGIYIKKCDKKLAYAIAQRDYDEALLKIVEERLKRVQSLLEYCQNHELEQVYEKLNPFRKEIVRSRIMTDKEYAEKWNSVIYEGKTFADGTAVIYTDRGERVRSKSEKIIADTLLKKGISYRYEAPITLRGLGIIYPDFTVLNVSKREEIFWEHLGMMDNNEYCERALRKIESYQQNGIFLGKNLIITYETSKYPLETQMIDRNIKEYCLK
ncbi:MAG: hypothetical protein LUF92_01785 [Clostridiales bacterium]|nr:hypothetical protein [Clostridiales bacterium]